MKSLTKRRSTVAKGFHHEFSGLLAPVFTCFNADEDYSLTVEFIEDYARFLKDHRVKGVAVNSIVGEGPAQSLWERKINAESWSVACEKHNLLMLVQVGGAPLPDVLELAVHASNLNVHGIICVPESLYKPANVEHLVGYCKIVAGRCRNHPFFYYHIPRLTQVDVNMEEFCQRAEAAIPNFKGLLYSHYDLVMGAKCLKSGRTILLGESKMLASAMLLGFEAGIMTPVNMIPDQFYAIYDAMVHGNLRLAKEQQKSLNNLIKFYAANITREGWVGAMKNWFNDQMQANAGFSAGPSRKYH